MNRHVLFCFIWLLTSSASMQGWFPDLSKPGDIADMGKGKIVEKDNSVIKNILLKEVREHWIVFIKNESLHDKSMEVIRRIEFPESKWGRIKVEFPNNKAEVSVMLY